MTLSRLVAYLPNGVSQGPLPAPQDMSVSFPLNDVGAIQLTYPLDSPQAAVLGQPLEIAVEVSTDQGATWAEPRNGRFLYLRDGRDPVKQEAWSVEGPSYVQRLAKALVPFTGLDTNGRRSFTNANPGSILNTLLGEAQARGALTGISWTFTAVNDSNAVAWAAGTQQSIGYEPGTDFLSILLAFVDAGLVDFRMNGRNLEMYPAGSSTGMGADRTTGANPVSLRYGRDLVEAPMRRTWEGVADTAYVQGDGTANLIRTNGAAITPWGRQETFVTASGTTDTGTLTTIADGSLSLTAASRSERTYGLVFDAATFLPFRDYAPGEWVYGATDGLLGPERMRVRQITLTKDANGAQAGNIVLNDRFVEADIRQARDLAKLTSGAVQGGNGSSPIGADILAPAQVAGLGGSSTAYVDAWGNVKAQISLAWTAVTTNADGTAASDINGYEVHRRRQGATTWDLYKSVNANSFSDSPYEPNEAWEFRVRAFDNAYNRGAFSSTFGITTAADATPPPTPSAAILTSTTPGVIQVRWDGLNNVGAAMPADFRYVEVHMSATNGFTPTAGALATLVGILTKAGNLNISGKAEGSTQYVRLISVDTSGNVQATASTQASVVVQRKTDGVAPTVPGGWALTFRQFAVGALEVAWPQITNPDPVNYDVYVAAGAPVSVFNATTLSGTVEDGTSLVIRGLPDGTALDPTVDYYVAVRVRDTDGTAATTTTAGPLKYRMADAAIISADWVYANAVQANQIQTGSLQAALAVANEIFAGSLTGRRISLSSDGLAAVDSSGNVVVNIPTNLSDDIALNANIAAKTLTADGLATLRNVSILPSSTVTLQAGTQAPTSPTVATNEYVHTQFNTPAPLDTIQGGSVFPTGNLYLAVKKNISGPFWQWQIIERNPVTGATVGTVTTVAGSGSNGEQILDVVRISTDFYTLVKRPGPKSGVAGVSRFYIQRRAVATPGTLTSEWEFLPSDTGVSDVVMNLDGTNVILAWFDNAAGFIKFATHNPSTGAVVTAAVTTGTTAPPTAVIKGTFDLGATKVVMIVNGATGTLLRTYATTGSRDATNEWLLEDTDYASAFWHDGTTWKTARMDPDNAGSNIALMVSYDGPWTAGGSATTPLSVTQTWYDGDTSGATLTHETNQGPVTAFTYRRRARIRLTSGAAIPSDSNPLNFDDADRVRFYIGNSTGTQATQWLHATTAAGSTTAQVASLTFSGSNPPAANTFAAGTAAKIVDATGTYYLDANGDQKNRNLIADTFRNLDAASNWTAYSTITADVTPSGTTNSTLTLTTSLSITSPGTWATYLIHAEPLVTFAGVQVNVVECLVDGVAQTVLLYNAGAVTTDRGSGTKTWYITGLSAGVYTVTFRTRNSAAGTNAVVRSSDSSFWWERVI